MYKRVLLILVAALILIAGMGVFVSFPLLTMRPAETGAISGTNIYAIQNNINAVYFIQTGSGHIMVDAGSDAKGIEAALKENGITIDSVKWIALTHSDYDHVAALSLFPTAKMYMGEDELPLVNSAVKRNAFS
ncbi:MAG: MBL fold metallo-hydrolase [Lachnoclostridium sp.]|jgi:glyoxylase-like metal-dependent hydrolase (beta-lactamase superfamily II)|nr:MBL fold metallo-hydrolase [Lachnoclostridium sp.]